MLVSIAILSISARGLVKGFVARWCLGPVPRIIQDGFPRVVDLLEHYSVPPMHSWLPAISRKILVNTSSVY